MSARALLAVLGAVLLAALPATGARAQAPGLGGSIELVDPHTLRVCADPRDLPFSDQAREGFENKIAELLARKLGRPVAYTYFPQVIGFYRNTLNAFRCDVVMGVVQGDDIVQTTNPYYRTSYALVFKPGRGLDSVTTLEDPRLKDKRLGVIARTPPATLMVMDGLMDKAKPYPLTVDTRVEAPAKSMIGDLLADRIDAAVLWGPLAGYYAKQPGANLSVTPLLKEHGVPMDFRISMGVRHSDQDWKRTLNKLIRENQDAINKILAGYGVPLLDEDGKPLAP
ncbi:MAG: substrate-binding domain-containing protein [Alphaproteobacteria bacterium]|nr:substrate-binding domain-containing protein [Alphaproteobacteria bacterium]